MSDRMEPPFICVTVPDAGDDYRRVMYRESVGYEREVYDALRCRPVGSRVVIGAWCYERLSAAGAIHAEWCSASANNAPCYGPTDADRRRAIAEESADG